jgi:hypothetical protein
VLGALALAGCKDRPASEAVKTPDVGQVFPHLLVPPQATLVSRSGSEDALQLVFETPVAREQVLGYYRANLTRNPWQLIGDTPSEDGAVVLFAERNRVPLWIRIVGDSVGGGSRVEMSGALVGRPDSAVATPTQNAGADSAPAARTDSLPPR